MKLYRFSPMGSELQLREAVNYLAVSVTDLGQQILGERLPITYLTVCAHYEDEYRYLFAAIAALGKVEEANNGVMVSLSEPLTYDGCSIANLRVRKPDPYRMQVGCGDFLVADYENFKRANLDSNQHLRLIERPDYEMIEFFHPDYDVLAYIVGD